MKRIFVTMILMLMFVGITQAQISKNDNLFTDWEDVGNGLDKGGGISLPPVPGGHGGTNDVPVPLGSGLLVLTALGAGYALTRKHKE